MNVPNLPPDVLEQRAAEQRLRLHQSVVELKSTVQEEVRERLDVNRYAREYFWQAAGVVSLLGFLVGHSFAGIFTRH